MPALFFLLDRNKSTPPSLRDVYVILNTVLKVGRGYHQLNPYLYPPKPYPVRVGYKHRAGKPAVSNLWRVI
jgi:hypothetical protein